MEFLHRFVPSFDNLNLTLPPPGIVIAYAGLLIQAILPIYFGSYLSLKSKGVCLSPACNFDAEHVS